MLNFTQGPWRCLEPPNENKKEFGVFAMEGNEPVWIADCPKEANARLISFTPGMYELLKTICEEVPILPEQAK